MAVIDVYIATRLSGLRPGEIELSTPLGIAAYSTTARLRKVEYRVIGAAGKREYAKGEVSNNREANRWVKPAFRKGWELKL